MKVMIDEKTNEHTEGTKLIQFEKENRDLIKVNQFLNKDIKNLNKKIKSLETTLANFDKVLEFSRNELFEKDKMIQALQTVSELSVKEKDNLQATMDAFKSVADFSDEERNDAVKMIKAHEKVERLSWVERRIIDRDLLMAQKIQFSLLGNWPKIDNLDIAVKYIPADRLGGDFYSINKIDNNKLFIFISDVAGHGTQASLITMIIKTLLENLIIKYVDPADFLFHLNHELYKIVKDLKIFATAAVFIFDYEKDILEYANAGHPCPLFFDKNRTVKELKAKGTILGAFDNLEYEKISYQLKKDTLFLAYTDGITELTNNVNEMYGDERLIGILTHADKKATSQDMLDIILEDIKQFSGTFKNEDDISLLLINYR
jgi:serine phosphatase RsbU (regulator of sigma subunit)